jgi:hypothetical protein
MVPIEVESLVATAGTNASTIFLSGTALGRSLEALVACSPQGPDDGELAAGRG